MSNQQQKANLRVCMACEWLYEGADLPCPQCGWPSEGARAVYGNRAYEYRQTQALWYNKKMNALHEELLAEIKKHQKKRLPRNLAEIKIWREEY